MRNVRRTLLLAAGLALVSSTACSSRAGVRIEPAAARASEPAATATVATAAPVHHDPPRAVTVALLGDLMFARDVTSLMEQHGVAYPFERVRAMWAGADIVAGNLEGTYTSRGTALTKEYTFRTPPRLAEALTAGGVQVVSLANNHTFDFGAVGLSDTLAALQAAGVGSFGAGEHEEAATRPLIVTTGGGLRVAFLGFDDIGEVQFATARQPGVAQADTARIRRAVQQATAEADWVVVFIHWGAEYRHDPGTRQRALAQAAIEAGASVVVGTHPHVLQPWEQIGAGVVLFSLGNFVFDLEPADVDWLGEGPFQTAVAMLTLSLDGPPQVAFRPVMIDAQENRPRPATAAEARAILALLDPVRAAAR